MPMALVFKINCAVALLLASGNASSGAGEPVTQRNSAEVRLYVGTLTSGTGQGIYQCSLNIDTGELESLAVVGEVKNPSFLVIAPHGKLLYACCEFNEYVD
jgi:hypothetical protein